MEYSKRILYSSWNKWTTVTCNNMNEPEQYNIKMWVVAKVIGVFLPPNSEFTDAYYYFSKITNSRKRKKKLLMLKVLYI